MTDSVASVRATDRFLGIFALGFGTGLVPRGPGTAGSLLGPPLVWCLGADGRAPWLAVIAGVLLFLVGIPICNAGTRLLGKKDPGQVVFDEIVAFFWVFLLTPVNWVTGIAGFVLFRIFDIAKPWPIRRFEQLPGGLGVMADDAIAGMMAGAILAIGWRIFT